MRDKIKKEEGETEIEMLARIVVDRFDVLENRFDILEKTMATKQDVHDLRTEMNQRFDDVDNRLAILENVKFHNLETRLEKQEDKMLQAQVFLKTKFA